MKALRRIKKFLVPNGWTEVEIGFMLKWITQLKEIELDSERNRKRERESYREKESGGYIVREEESYGSSGCPCYAQRNSKQYLGYYRNIYGYSSN